MGLVERGGGASRREGSFERTAWIVIVSMIYIWVCFRSTRVVPIFRFRLEYLGIAFSLVLYDAQRDAACNDASVAATVCP